MHLVLKLAPTGATPKLHIQELPEGGPHLQLKTSQSESGQYQWTGFFIACALLLVLTVSPIAAKESQNTTFKLSPQTPLNIDWEPGIDYQIQLPTELTGNWLVTLEQQGVDLAPALLNSKGEPVIAVDVTGYSIGIERLALYDHELNSSLLKLPRTSKIDSPGSFTLKLIPIGDPELFKLLRQLMAATALLIDKDAQLPADIDCQADISGLAKDPGRAGRCFQAALNSHKPAFTGTISRLELEYYLADSVRRQGMLTDAQRLYLPLIRQQQDIRLQALALHGIAWTVWRSGEHKIAETFIAQALEAYKQVSRQQPANKGVLYQLLSARNIACLILHDQEFLGRAEACYLDLLPDLQRANDRDTENALLGNLGGVYYQRGEIAEARKQFEMSYNQYKRIGDRSNEAGALGTLGLVEVRAGNLEAALNKYHQAELLAARYAPSRVNIYRLWQARIYTYLGDWQRGKLLYQLLEKAARQNGNLTRLGIISYELAQGFDSHGQIADARKYYLQNLDIRRKLGNITWIADALLYLAEFEGHQGKLGLAEEYLSQATPLLAQIETSKVPTRALHIEGEYLLSKADYPGAIKQLNAALSAYRDIGYEFKQAVVETALVDAYVGAGRLGLAEQTAIAAIDRYMQLRPENISLDLRASYSSKQRLAYEKLIDLYLLRWQQDKNPLWSRKALIWSERARAQTLREALENTGRGQLLSQDKQLQRQALSDRINALATMRLAAMDKQQDLDALNHEYQQALAGLERFDKEHNSLTSGASDLITQDDLDIDHLLASLPQQTAWLAYYLSDKIGVFWVLAQGQLKTYQLPSTAALRTGISEVLTALRRPGASLQAADRLAELSRWLDPQLPASITRITITADGILNNLPFAALRVAGQTNEYWLQRYTINYSPYLVIPTATPVSQPQWSSLNIFADPEYDHASISSPLPYSRQMVYPADLGLSRLRVSAVEAREVAALASADKATNRKVEIYSGADATRSRILDGSASSAAILHFATHGIFEQQASSLAGLALAVADTQGVEQAWLLTAQDIYQSPVNARLVVMSACDTGTGKLAAGEGILGLVRAFLYTGVEAVLSSQWKVSDRASVALMTAFYSSLLGDKQTVSAALRQAQLELLTSDRYSDPFYWAGFSDFQIKGF